MACHGNYPRCLGISVNPVALPAIRANLQYSLSTPAQPIFIPAPMRLTRHLTGLFLLVSQAMSMDARAIQMPRRSKRYWQRPRVVPARLFSALGWQPFTVRSWLPCSLLELNY